MTIKWNWQQKDWPKFSYQSEELRNFEAKFLYASGEAFGVYQHLNKSGKEALKIDIIRDEALKTSEIEGEILNRDSLQSSIKRNFGITNVQIPKKIPPAEEGIADMMTDLYRNFADKLYHQTLFNWHKMLMSGRRDVHEIGKYRTDPEAMQIVSGKLHDPKVHFEALPSKKVKKEMDRFIQWFNDSAPAGKNPLPALTRAGITHLYFVSIHPFEDGNGRIARALVVKALSQALSRPLLTSLSTIIQANKKKYYQTLEASNQRNEITKWLIYFADTFLQSQNYTKKLIEFLVAKGKLYARLRDQLNPRQEKVLARMFKEGINGFKGGLSAENYLTLTKTSRATATRDLQDLVDKKVLIKAGELKSTRYRLDWLSK